jgi:hypothetical protein
VKVSRPNTKSESMEGSAVAGELNQENNLELADTNKDLTE